MEDHRPIRLLLTGGGTGGHLFPAIATAENIISRFPGSRVLFLGTRRKMDSERLVRLGYEARAIDCQGLKGKKLTALITALLLLPVSFCQALFQIVRFRPNLVLGVGGYVTGPVVAAARVLGKATVIHEQNSIPGLANRKLANLAHRICLSLPGSEKYFPAEKVRMTGNPVRRDIVALAQKKKEQFKTKKTLLVLGGSLGAHRLNTLVLEAICDVNSGLSDNMDIIHQTGEKDEQMVREYYQKAGVKAHVKAFFSDMVSVYDKADILVSRAGATTLAELAVLGKPAVLIPYPYAADNHQEKNAQYYVEAGGAFMFREKDLSAALLVKQLTELLDDESKLSQMGQAMKELGRPEAVDNIVDICLELL